MYSNSPYFEGIKWFFLHAIQLVLTNDFNRIELFAAADEAVLFRVGKLLCFSTLPEKSKASFLNEA